AYSSGQKQLAQDLDYLSGHCPGNSSLKDLIEGKVRPQIQGLQAAFARLIQQVRTGKIQEARSHLEEADAQFQVFHHTMEEINQETDRLRSEARGVSRSTYRQMVMTVLGFALFAFLLGGGVAWWITRLVARPLAEMAAVANRLAVGDTVQAVSLQRNDE